MWDLQCHVSLYGVSSCYSFLTSIMNSHADEVHPQLTKEEGNSPEVFSAFCINYVIGFSTLFTLIRGVSGWEDWIYCFFIPLFSPQLATSNITPLCYCSSILTNATPMLLKLLDKSLSDNWSIITKGHVNAVFGLGVFFFTHIPKAYNMWEIFHGKWFHSSIHGMYGG